MEVEEHKPKSKKPSWPGNKVRPDVCLCCVRRVW